ncbi:MAG: hypothetical protein E7324_08450 [Clostridiales bacterium]|nr:hypothetical protein [Clostridiales bacterium]
MCKADRPTVVCLGFFDGVHRGHLALLAAARKVAASQGWLICAHTFDRAPGSKGALLTGLSRREELLKQAGADFVAVSPFDEQMRMMDGDAFFREIVLGQLHAAHVVCGDDHRFGHQGAWGVAELKNMCDEAGIGLTVVPEVALPGGMRISTSAIRKALADGDYALAEEMLGRPLEEA